MTEPSTSPSVLRPLPAAGAVRTPTVAAGLLTALAVGASVLLLPTGGSAAEAGPVTAVAAQPVAAGPALLHPVQPEPGAATTAVQPARQARDPFRPLLVPPDQGTSAPAESPTVSSPDSGASTGGTPGVQLPDFQLPDFQVPDVVEPPRVSEPSVPSGSSASVSEKELELTKVEVTGETFVAVLAIDGEKVRAKVGDSFGPAGQLLLLSLQQGPRDSQWTAVVQAGSGEPFDVVSGTPTRIP